MYIGNIILFLDLLRALLKKSLIAQPFYIPAQGLIEYKQLFYSCQESKREVRRGPKSSKYQPRRSAVIFPRPTLPRKRGCGGAASLRPNLNNTTQKERGLRPSSLDLDLERSEGRLDCPDLRALDHRRVRLDLLVAHLQANRAAEVGAADVDVERGTQVGHADLLGGHPVDEAPDVLVLAESMSNRNIADRPVLGQLGSRLLQGRLDVGILGDFLDELLLGEQLGEKKPLRLLTHSGERIGLLQGLGDGGSGGGLGSASGILDGHEILRLFLLMCDIEERARNISISLSYD